MKAVQYFLLVVTDADDAAGSKIAALNLAQYRLRACKWPMYRNTQNRKSIQKGDAVLVYIGGRKSMSGNVIAKAIVQEISSYKSSQPSLDPDTALTDTPHFVLHLANISRITPVNLRETIFELSIAPKNKQKWGMALMGGCRRLSKDDYEIIVGEQRSA
jgi:ribosomal protein L24